VAEATDHGVAVGDVAAPSVAGEGRDVGLDDREQRAAGDDGRQPRRRAHDGDHGDATLEQLRRHAAAGAAGAAEQEDPAGRRAHDASSG
jgi:hypothetical protein